MRILLLLLALLMTFAPAALAAEIRPQQLTAAVATSSGIPNPDVSCETDPAAWQREVMAVGAGPNDVVGGYTLASRVRLAPWVCADLIPGAARFGDALYVVGVESARLAGHRGPGSEAMAGCWGLMWAADLARRIWGVPFFTAASERVIRQALAFHRASYDRYRTLCV